MLIFKDIDKTDIFICNLEKLIHFVSIIYINFIYNYIKKSKINHKTDVKEYK